jgi:hypothetical protein
MIVAIWATSTIMGVAPHLFGLSSLQNSDTCHLTDNLAYQLLSTFFAFYLPLVFMCVIYWKIFQSAKFRIRKRAFNIHNRRTADKSLRAKSQADSKPQLAIEPVVIELAETVSRFLTESHSNA